MKRKVILLMVLVILTTGMFAVATSRTVQQKLIFDESSTTNILSMINNTGTTMNPNYILRVVHVETGEVRGTDLGASISSFRIYKTGNGTTVPYFAAAIFNQSQYTANWPIGSHLTIQIWYNGATNAPGSIEPYPDYEYAEKTFSVPSGTGVISFTTAGTEMVVPPFSNTNTILSAINPIPANGDMVRVTQASPVTLSWQANTSSGNPAPEGYKLYWNGSPDPIIVSSPTWTTPILETGYTYTWKIVPFLEGVDALNCPTWGFWSLWIPAAASGPVPADYSQITVQGNDDITLSWLAPTTGFPPDGYRIMFCGDEYSYVNASVTSITIPNITSGDYTWQIIPGGIAGEAENCPIWHFSILSPQVQYDQTTIAFDHVWKDHTATKALRIENTGNMDLTIDLLLNPGVFSLADGVTSYIVPAGGYTLVNINFLPTAYQSYSRNLYIETNDPNHLYQTIVLSGTGYELEAAFTASTYSGVAPLEVLFTDNSSSTVQSWLWNFGDNESSDLTNPNHSYTYAGNYEVTLTVSDAYHSRSISQFINVSGITTLNPEPSDNSFNLGSTYLGVPTAAQHLNFSSIGTALLTISSVYWENGSRGFAFDESVDGLSYGLNESFGLNVYLLPTANGTVSDVLIIQSNADNSPVYRVTFTGTGLYVPPAVPANVTLTMQDENGQISWDAVTLSVLDTPIVPDYYFVYFNGSSDPDGPYYFLGRSFSTQFVHYDVALGASDMFYRVKAIKLYRRGGNIDTYLDQHLRVGMSEEEVSKILSAIE